MWSALASVPQGGGTEAKSVADLIDHKTVDACNGDLPFRDGATENCQVRNNFRLFEGSSLLDHPKRNPVHRLERAASRMQHAEIGRIDEPIETSRPCCLSDCSADMVGVSPREK